MPTPTGGYRNAAGKRVPGTTTILDRIKESGGLMWWANRLALEPLLEIRALVAKLHATTELRPDNLAEFNGNLKAVEAFLAIDPDLWDHRKAAQKAADAGTCAHALFDAHVRRNPQQLKDLVQETPPEIYAMAEPAFRAAIEWAQQSRFEVVETEVSLVSERYQFGGTRDGILISGKRAIGDVKTSKAIYPEMLLQIAAYGILDEEQGNTIDGGFHILKFSKQEKPEDPIRFSHHYWDQLDTARKAFLLARELYGLMNDVERQAK